MRVTQRRPSGESRGSKALQAAAALAVGAAAAGLVATLGAYLHVRFTQHRRKPPAGGDPPPPARP